MPGVARENPSSIHDTCGVLLTSRGTFTSVSASINKSTADHPISHNTEPNRFLGKAPSPRRLDPAARDAGKATPVEHGLILHGLALVRTLILDVRNAPGTSRGAIVHAVLGRSRFQRI